MKPDLKKLIVLNIPYVIVWYLVDKLCWLYRMAEGTLAGEKLLYVFLNFQSAFAKPLPSIHPVDVLVGIAGALLVKAVIYFRHKNAKKFREGVEYGSARWGTAADIKPFMDEDPENNIILTETEKLTMSSRPKNPKYARNKNIVVIGGSGSGKTRFFVKPNLMQCYSKEYPVSFVVTDPKGTLLVETGTMLKHADYQIRSLNLINLQKSMHYNPFMYIHSEKDILKLVNTIIANTKGEGDKSGEDFWVKAEKLYYQALIGYIWYEAPDEEKNFSTLLELINASEAKEEDENYQNAVDLMFAELERRKPDHFAVRQYKKYKLSSGVISLKRLLNHNFLRNWSSKMIKKSLEAYFLPKTQNCTFLKTFSKDGNILLRQSGYSVRNFSNRHKIQRNLKKLRYYLVKQRPKDGLSERNFFEDPYTNLDNGAACP